MIQGNKKTTVCLLIALLLVPIGCGASGILRMSSAAWLVLGGVALAALVARTGGSGPKRPGKYGPIGPDTPAAEVRALIMDNIVDLERWENEGGATADRPR